MNAQVVATQARRISRVWDGRVLKESFDRAAQHTPWTLGFANPPAETLACASLTLEGDLPRDLNGVLYRNGPAWHEHAGQRYGHCWDADGMVQAFRIGGGQVSHQAATIRTRKFVAERVAGKLLFSTFGTHVPGTQTIPGSIDDANVANISVLPLGDELLALWEPGSAYRLDPQSLATLGSKVWAPALAGYPFSAHPKRDADGTIWNFGVDVLRGRLTLYRIGASGSLEAHVTLEVDHLPPVHDFGITSGHLVFLLPSLALDRQRLSSGVSFAESCAWNPQLPMRAMVVRKSDWAVRWYELPAGCLFHVGSAGEDRQGNIRIAYLRAADPLSLLSGWSVMRGVYRHMKGAEMTVAELHADGRASQQALAGHELEYPATDPCLAGGFAQQMICLERTPACDPGMVGFDAVVMIDTERGVMDRWVYGPGHLVEEHLLVVGVEGSAATARWLVGTSLNLARRQTVLSVFDARQLSAGPVVQAWLPYAVPLGLHGAFRAACR